VWTVSQNDQIIFPTGYGLGTKSSPNTSDRDRIRLNVEESFSSDTTQGEGSPFERTEEDGPTTDQPVVYDMEQTAEELERLSVTPKPEERMQETQTYEAQIAHTYPPPKFPQPGHPGDHILTPLMGQAKKRYSEAGRLLELASWYRKQAETLEARAVEEEAAGDRLVGLAADRQEALHRQQDRHREQDRQHQTQVGPPRGQPGAPKAAAGGQAGAVPPAGESMRGHPPETFDGQRKNAEKFVREIELWSVCNLRNEAMVNPYTRVALAPSYIKGSRVDDWVYEQTRGMATKVYENQAVQPPIPAIYADNDD